MIDPRHRLQNSSISPGVVILVTTFVQAWHLVSIGTNDPQNRPARILSITVLQCHECLLVFISHPLQCDAKAFHPLEHINLDHIILGKTHGRTGYLSIGHMRKHMLIGGINALPYSHMPTVHI